MRILSWNIDFWKRTCNSKQIYKKQSDIIEWKNNSFNLLNNYINNYDFILLQEFNPFIYYKNNIRKPYLYEIHCKNNNLFYHEFTYELTMKNFILPNKLWGNAIIAHKKYKIIDNEINENKYYDSYYYGRSGQMFYDFKMEN